MAVVREVSGRHERVVISISVGTIMEEGAQRRGLCVCYCRAGRRRAPRGARRAVIHTGSFLYTQARTRSTAVHRKLFDIHLCSTREIDHQTVKAKLITYTNKVSYLRGSDWSGTGMNRWSTTEWSECTDTLAGAIILRELLASQLSDETKSLRRRASAAEAGAARHVVNHSRSQVIIKI